jgi:hypothetical protein
VECSYARQSVVRSGVTQHPERPTLDHRLATVAT